MTVTDLEKGKIKITLNDKEIVALFGTYQRLYAMTDSIKPTFERILEKVLLSRGLSLKEELLIQIKAKPNAGCTILISRITELNRKKEYLFIFENSHTLTEGMLFLFRNKNTRALQSKLYKTCNDYRLIIYSKNESPYFLTLKEYCKKSPYSPFSCEYTKEHGKLLITKNAISTFGKYFFKEI
jgi:negative regulator of genetic competence, sporulation and motility